MKEFGINDEMEGDSLESKLNFTQTRIENKIEGWLLVKNIKRIEVKNTFVCNFGSKARDLMLRSLNEPIFSYYDHLHNITENTKI
jgi:hypothetical protein